MNKIQLARSRAATLRGSVPPLERGKSHWFGVWSCFPNEEEDFSQIGYIFVLVCFFFPFQMLRLIKIQLKGSWSKRSEEAQVLSFAGWVQPQAKRHRGNIRE